MLSALLALPLAQNAWHGPEVAAILAIAATAQFAGHRWAIAVIVLSELLLLPTVWPRAFLEGDLSSRLSALVTLVAMVPGLLAMRRAAAALVVLTGQRHPRQMRRILHAERLESSAHRLHPTAARPMTPASTLTPLRMLDRRCSRAKARASIETVPGAGAAWRRASRAAWAAGSTTSHA